MTRPFRQALNVIFTLLLLTSVLSLVFVYIWGFTPGLVDRVDNSLVARYVNSYQLELDDAIKAVNSDVAEEVAVEGLIDFLGKLDAIKGQDRLNPLKVRALTTLIDELEKGDRYEEAIYWCDEWLSYDDNNLNALLTKVRILEKIEGRDAEAFDILSLWHKRLPGNERLAVPLLGLIAKRGESIQTLNTLSLFSQAKYFRPYDRWRVFWSDADGFSAARSKWADEVDLQGATIRVSANISEKIESIRFDPPDFNSSWCIDNPTIQLVAGNRQAQFSLSRINTIHSPDMAWDGSRLRVSTGSDPYFLWALPDELKEGISQIVFSAEVTSCIPTWISDVLSNDEIQQLQSDPQVVNNSTLLALLGSIQEENQRTILPDIASMPTQMHVYWRLEEQSYSAQRRETANLLVTNPQTSQFEVSLPVDDTAQAIRIDFADTIGLRHRIDSIRVDSIAGVIDIDLATISTSGLARRGDVFETIDNDPQLLFSVAEPYTNIRSVLVRGTIQ